MRGLKITPGFVLVYRMLFGDDDTMWFIPGEQ